MRCEPYESPSNAPRDYDGTDSPPLPGRDTTMTNSPPKAGCNTARGIPPAHNAIATPPRAQQRAQPQPQTRKDGQASPPSLPPANARPTRQGDAPPVPQVARGAVGLRDAKDQPAGTSHGGKDAARPPLRPIPQPARPDFVAVRSTITPLDWSVASSSTPGAQSSSASTSAASRSTRAPAQTPAQASGPANAANREPPPKSKPRVLAPPTSCPADAPAPAVHKASNGSFDRYAEGRAREKEGLESLAAKVAGVRAALANRKPYTREDAAKSLANKERLKGATETAAKKATDTAADKPKGSCTTEAPSKASKPAVAKAAGVSGSTAAARTKPSASAATQTETLRPKPESAPRFKTASTQTDPERPQPAPVRSTRDKGLSTASPIHNAPRLGAPDSSAPKPALPAPKHSTATSVSKATTHSSAPQSRRELAKASEVLLPPVSLSPTIKHRAPTEQDQTDALMSRKRRADARTAAEASRSQEVEAPTRSGPPSSPKETVKGSAPKQKARTATPSDEASTHSTSKNLKQSYAASSHSSRHLLDGVDSPPAVSEGAVSRKVGALEKPIPFATSSQGTTNRGEKEQAASETRSTLASSSHPPESARSTRAMDKEKATGVELVRGVVARQSKPLRTVAPTPNSTTTTSAEVRRDSKVSTAAFPPPSQAGKPAPSPHNDCFTIDVAPWPALPGTPSSPSLVSMKTVASHHARFSKADTVISSIGSIIDAFPAVPDASTVEPKAHSKARDSSSSRHVRSHSALTTHRSSVADPEAETGALLTRAHSLGSTRSPTTPTVATLAQVDVRSIPSVTLTRAFQDEVDEEDDDFVYHSYPAYLDSLIRNKPLPRIPSRTSTVLSAESLAKLDENIAELQRLAPRPLKSAMKTRADLVSCALGDGYALVQKADARESLVGENVAGPSNSKAVRFNVQFPSTTTSSQTSSPTDPNEPPASTSTPTAQTTRVSQGVEVPVDNPPRYSDLSPLMGPFSGSSISLPARTRRDRSQSDVTERRQSQLRHAQSVPFLQRSNTKLQRLMEARRASPYGANELGSRSATSLSTMSSSRPPPRVVWRGVNDDEERAKKSVAGKMWQKAKNGLGLKKKEEEPEELPPLPSRTPFENLPPRPRPRPDWYPKEKVMVSPWYAAA